METRRRMQAGTIGRLRLTIGSHECEDDVEVAHCEAVPGPRPIYRVGVRFLWTKPPSVGSIRHAIAHHLLLLEAPETTFVM
jgi:hypothetical protein